MNDPDIGMCDLCGSEDGRRYPTRWHGVIAWLCAACRTAELHKQAS